MADPSIVTAEDLNFLHSNIPTPPGKVAISKQCYLASELGRLENTDLFAAIEGRSNLLLIVSTVAGTVMGGYISQSIRLKETSWVKDDASFVFGLKAKNSTKRVILKALSKEANHWRFHNVCFGPSFNASGEYALRMHRGKLQAPNESFTNASGGRYEESKDGPFSLNGGERNLGPILDYEVRQVLFVDKQAAVPVPSPVQSATKPVSEPQQSKILTDEATALKNENANLKQFQANAEARIAALTAQVATLQQANAALVDQNNALSAADQHNKAQLNALFAENASIKQQLSTVSASQSEVVALKQQNIALKRDLLDRLTSNIAGGSCAHVELIAEVMGVVLPPGTVTSLNIDVNKILAEEDGIDFIENYSPDVGLGLLHVHVIVHHMHKQRSLPPNKPVSDWIANVKQMADVASRFAKLNISEEVMRVLDARKFDRDLGMSAKDLKKLQADFVASRGETVLMPL